MIVFLHDWGSYVVVSEFFGTMGSWHHLNSFPALFFAARDCWVLLELWWNLLCPGKVQPFGGTPKKSFQQRLRAQQGWFPSAWPGTHCCSPKQNQSRVQVLHWPRQTMERTLFDGVKQLQLCVFALQLQIPALALCSRVDPHNGCRRTCDGDASLTCRTCVGSPAEHFLCSFPQNRICLYALLPH